uniref:fibrinogen-like YCDxxxxGGGW domain-containing protein n=1 Tax=Salmonella sp. s51933 TaxID=3160127 RepID=UPI003753F7BC
MKILVIAVLNLLFLVLPVLSTMESCQGSGCPQPEITARSCLDYLKKGFKSNGFYYIYNFHDNRFMTVYCDMTSEAGAAWTLIMSFSLNHENMDEFNKKTLTDDAPVNERSPNWHLYRISTSQMNHMKSQSSHWRVTCSFPTHGVDYTDYVRAEFEHFDVMTFTGHGVCKKVEYVNIRGHHCVQCTTKW